jgi:hypothetical protein
VSQDITSSSIRLAIQVSLHSKNVSFRLTTVSSLAHTLRLVGSEFSRDVLDRSNTDQDGLLKGMPADEIQALLEEHTKQRLPHHMGQACTDMVLACVRGAFVGGK